MILFKDKSQCCGCGACAQRCPKSCIIMSDDEQGFLYPKVDEDSCVNCGLCENVCPMLNPGEPRKPLATYAAIHRDEKIRLASSSGGVFTALAEYIIKQGGVVFGARFNDKWEVIHDWTDTIEGLAAFRGSKYVQSLIGDNYLKAEQFLKKGRQVLFTGTPCQIAGLKRFLKSHYVTLFTLDVVCHGVPSPLIWKDYIKKYEPQEVNFRDKRNGWKDFSLSFIPNRCVSHSYDSYMQAFLKNISLRQSCFNCRHKKGVSGADISIADFWGVSSINPNLDDDKGTSLVLVYNPSYTSILENQSIMLVGMEYDSVVNLNYAIESSVKEPKEYKSFWKLFLEKGLSSIDETLERMRPSKMKSFITAINYKLKLEICRIFK